jgi:hypothetical protein
VPRALSVIGVVLFAFVVIFAIGGVIASQLTELAGDLPRYQQTMREKIQSLRGATATSGTLERAADVLQDLGKELEKPKDRASSPPIAIEAPTLPLLPHHDCAALVVAYDVERVLADIDADHGDCAVGLI